MHILEMRKNTQIKYLFPHLREAFSEAYYSGSNGRLTKVSITEIELQRLTATPLQPTISVYLNAPSQLLSPFHQLAPPTISPPPASGSIQGRPLPLYHSSTGLMALPSGGKARHNSLQLKSVKIIGFYHITHSVIKSLKYEFWSPCKLTLWSLKYDMQFDVLFRQSNTDGCGTSQYRLPGLRLSSAV